MTATESTRMRHPAVALAALLMARFLAEADALPRTQTKRTSCGVRVRRSSNKVVRWGDGGGSPWTCRRQLIARARTQR